MPTYHQYWNLIRLNTNGGSKPQELPAAKALIQQLRPQAQATDEVDNDRDLQRQLCQTINTSDSGDSDNPDNLETHFQHPATLCLRCYISHQTVRVCSHLVEQFGKNYGFGMADLLPTVLDDDGRPLSGPYRPLSYKILNRFDPDSASLSTWASRLVRHSDDLNHWLKEQGLLLISDWALLNDTRPSKLKQTLLNFHQLSQTEFEDALVLLNAYHSVYRQARLMTGKKGRCEVPTPEQCQAIAAQLPNSAVQAQNIPKALRLLSQHIRTYDVARKKGIPQGISMDDPNAIDIADPSGPPPDDEMDWTALLQAYRTQLDACLTRVVKDVIAQRLQTLAPKSPKSKKPDKRPMYLTALRLFYCEGYNMSQLAPHIGLQKQYQVTRLLNLKQFCADIRHRAIACLQANLHEPFSQLMPPERLAGLDQTLEEHLGQEIDRLIQAETNRTQTPGQHRQNNSLLAEVICQTLQQNND